MVPSHSHHQHPLRIWGAVQLALMQLMMHESSEVPAQPASVLVSKTTLSCGGEQTEDFGVHVQACSTTVIVLSARQEAISI